jgi:hypothetical protein
VNKNPIPSHTLTFIHIIHKYSGLLVSFLYTELQSVAYTSQGFIASKFSYIFVKAKLSDLG